MYQYSRKLCVRMMNVRKKIFDTIAFDAHFEAKKYENEPFTSKYIIFLLDCYVITVGALLNAGHY